MKNQNARRKGNLQLLGYIRAIKQVVMKEKIKKEYFRRRENFLKPNFNKQTRQKKNKKTHDDA